MKSTNENITTIGEQPQIEKKSILYITIIGVLLIIAIVTGTAFFMEKRKQKGFGIAEDIADSFTAWEVASDTGKDEEMTNLLPLIDLGLEFGGYAKDRALFTKGLLALNNEEWETAGKAFQEIYKNSPKSYMAPAALCNAAQSLEMFDKSEDAIALYETTLKEYSLDLFQRPNIYFNLGRLYSVQGNKEKSDEYFEKVLSEFPKSNWANIINQYKIISEI